MTAREIANWGFIILFGVIIIAYYFAFFLVGYSMDLQESNGKKWRHRFIVAFIMIFCATIFIADTIADHQESNHKKHRHHYNQ